MEKLSAKEELKKFFNTLVPKKESIIDEETLNRYNRNKFLDITTDIINGLDEETNSGFYSNSEFGQYFADYLRNLYDEKLSIKLKSLLLGKKELTDEECIKILNNDLTKTALASSFNFEKDRNIKEAYNTFINVAAYTREKLTEKYGLENALNLDEVKNEEAKIAIEKFNDWEAKHYYQMKNLSELVSEKNLSKLSKSSIDPKTAFLGGGIFASGLPETIVGGGLGFMILCSWGLYLSHREYIKENLGYKDYYYLRDRYEDANLCFNVDIGIILAAGLLGSLGGYGFKSLANGHYQDVLDDVAKQYNFSNRGELLNYIQTESFKYISPEEGKEVFKQIINIQKENYAESLGYENLEALEKDIESHKSLQYQNNVEILSQIADERNIAREYLAKNSGFKSYNEFTEYLNTHKILTGEENGIYRAWSVYNYDTGYAKTLAKKLTNLDEKYDDITFKARNSVGADVEYTGKYAEYMSNLNAIEKVSHIDYKTYLNIKEEGIYSDNYLAGEAGNKLLDAMHGFGNYDIERIDSYDNANMLFDIPFNVGIASSAAAIGVRLAPYVVSAVKQHNINKKEREYEKARERERKERDYLNKR